jgi:hypothetical protein
VLVEDLHLVVLAVAVGVLKDEDAVAGGPPAVVAAVVHHVADPHAAAVIDVEVRGVGDGRLAGEEGGPQFGVDVEVLDRVGRVVFGVVGVGLAALFLLLGEGGRADAQARQGQEGEQGGDSPGKHREGHRGSRGGGRARRHRAARRSVLRMGAGGPVVQDIFAASRAVRLAPAYPTSVY